MTISDNNNFSGAPNSYWPNTNWDWAKNNQSTFNWTYPHPTYDHVLTRAQAIATALEAKAITRKEAREALKSLGAPFAAILA